MKKAVTKIVEKDGKEWLSVIMAEKDYFLPFKLIGGRKVGFLDISGQVSLIESCADLLTERILDSGKEFDTIINPVAKSNALAHAIAVRLMTMSNINLTHTVVARKAKPGEIHTVMASYHSVTTAVEQAMYLTDDDVEYIKGKKVLLLDDVYGQGGTTKGLTELCEKAGAKITGHAVIAVEAGTTIPEGLICLFELPVL